MGKQTVQAKEVYCSSKNIGLPKFLWNFRGLVKSFFKHLCASSQFRSFFPRADFVQCVKVSKDLEVPVCRFVSDSLKVSSWKVKKAKRLWFAKKNPSFTFTQFLAICIHHSK